VVHTGFYTTTRDSNEKKHTNPFALFCTVR
jgi:hypothetical protein